LHEEPQARAENGFDLQPTVNISLFFLPFCFLYYEYFTFFWENYFCFLQNKNF